MLERYFKVWWLCEPISTPRKRSESVGGQSIIVQMSQIVHYGAALKRNLLVGLLDLRSTFFTQELVGGTMDESRTCVSHSGIFSFAPQHADCVLECVQSALRSVRDGLQRLLPGAGTAEPAAAPAAPAAGL